MAPLDTIASLLKGASLTGSSSSSYLLTLPEQPALPSNVSQALAELEEQFTLDADLLKKTVDQMLWEYRTGLSTHVDDSNKDTFLPMM